MVAGWILDDQIVLFLLTSFCFEVQYMLNEIVESLAALLFHEGKFSDSFFKFVFLNSFSTKIVSSKCKSMCTQMNE